MNGCTKTIEALGGQLPEGYYFSEDGWLKDPTGLDLCHPQLYSENEVTFTDFVAEEPVTYKTSVQHPKGFPMVGVQKPWLLEHGLLVAVSILGVVFLIVGIKKLRKQNKELKELKAKMNQQQN